MNNPPSTADELRPPRRAPPVRLLEQGHGDHGDHGDGHELPEGDGDGDRGPDELRRFGCSSTTTATATSSAMGPPSMATATSRFPRGPAPHGDGDGDRLLEQGQRAERPHGHELPEGDGDRGASIRAARPARRAARGSVHASGKASIAPAPRRRSCVTCVLVAPRPSRESRLPCA